MIREVDLLHNLLLLRWLMLRKYFVFFRKKCSMWPQPHLRAFYSKSLVFSQPKPSRDEVGYARGLINKTEQGVVLVEFIMVLPFLLLLFLASAEISSYLRVSQIANVVSQEAAIQASRNCGDFIAFERDPVTEDLVLENNRVKVDSAAVANSTSACLNQIASSLRDNVNLVLLSSTGRDSIESIRISVFRFRPTFANPANYNCLNFQADMTAKIADGTSGDAGIEIYGASKTQGIGTRRGTIAVPGGSLAGSFSGGRCNGRLGVIVAEVSYRMFSNGPINGPRPDGSLGTIFSLFGISDNGLLRETTIL